MIVSSYEHVYWKSPKCMQDTLERQKKIFEVHGRKTKQMDVCPIGFKGLSCSEAGTSTFGCKLQ